MLKLNRLLLFVVIAALLATVYAPVVEASVVYGPEKFQRNTGAPGAVSSQFQVIDPHGNYTLYVRNGDVINGSGPVINGASSAIVRLNGYTIFGTKDFNQNTVLLSKDVTVQSINDMQVEVRSIPGSYLTAWIEDESPDVVITSPWDDTVSEGSITLAGYVADRNITSVLTIANGVTNQITVTGGNFTTGITISGPTKITVSAQDSTGTIRTALLCLDGDMLPESIEKQYGFDPLNPDSDSALTAENEAGNGIPDGYEVLGGQNPENTRLPAFVKAKVGGDLFKDDTDDDGLSDYFEVMLLGPFGDVRYADYNGDGIPDAGDDLDQDGLTNADEQLYGTDPLVADTDKDGLQDDHEVEVTGTVPTKADSDDDGLSDDSEIRLGTLPLNFDTDGDGVRDGDETYTSGSGNSTLGTTVSVTGKGDLGKQLRFHSVATTGGLNTSVLISPVVDISLNGSFDSARITMQYAPAPGLNPANLSLCYYDRAQGRYVPVASQVDAANHTVSADVTHFSSWGIFEVKNLLALYKMVSDYNNEAYNGLQPGIPQPGDTLLVPYDSTLTMTYLGGTAGYNNVFGLWSPFRKQYGTGHGTTPGTSFNLGTFKQGTELIFYDDNGAGNTWLSGPYSRNPDRVAHAYIRPIACDTWLLGWEDMYGGGDKDYDDVVLNLTFTRTARVDSDGDGLYDDVEIHGFKDWTGRAVTTLPNNPDTDGDGLEDGQEVQFVTDETGYTYIDVVSYPTTHDTDEDGLSDYIEFYEDTDPLFGDVDNDCLADGIEFAISTDTFEYDTDNDGYNDGDEYYGGYNPLVPGDHNDPLTIAREVFLGAILGEWAYEMPIHDNLYYMAGWMISGYAVAGDIRDVVVSITSLNGAGALLNSLCAAPVAGDIAKTLKVAEKFGAKHPDQAVKIARFVGKYVPLKTVDDKLQAIICFYGEDSAKALLDRGIQLNTLTDLAAQGVKRSDLEQLIDIHHIPAEDVLNIVRHNVDPVKLVKLLDNLKNEAYKGQWSPGKRGCSEANLDYHFRKHGPKDFGLSGNPGDAFGKQKYVDAAVESMKKQDGMEIYYDNWNHNIVKYERSTERFVVGNLDGELASLFKRPFNEIDKNLNRFIRIG